MSKIITIKIKKAGARTRTFSISDNRGNVLASNVSKDELINGKTLKVEDNISVILVNQTGRNCCSETIKLPISKVTKQDVVNIKFSQSDTGSLWRHSSDNKVFNHFYGCIYPYIIEYPFSYSYRDEIIQSVVDYSKVYTYLPSIDHVSDFNRRLQVDDVYFNKAVLYNDQQSTGTLELYPKPLRNMKAYMSYPKFKTNSKEIIYTKTDNFYQFNTFWNIVKDKTKPLFVSTCETLSIDKEINNDNMDYSTRSFRKDSIRGKDSKLRLILDNRSDIHIVSQVINEISQISYK